MKLSIKFLLIGILAVMPFSSSFAQSHGDSLTFDYSKMPSHPRLLLKRGEENKLMKTIEASKDLLKLHKGILRSADSILTLPPLERKMTGKRLLVCQEMPYRLFNLAYAYRMTGDKRYSEGARDEMLNICSFSDWNPSHYLDVAGAEIGIALAYDWVWPALSRKDRRTVSKGVLEKALKPSYTNNAVFYCGTNNWNQVCNAGMVWAALAFYEDHPELSQSLLEKSYISNHLVLPCYAPDGCYPEGFGYWTYGTQYQVMMNVALESIFGSDKGISDAKGFRESIDFINYMSSPVGKCFNYSDGGPDIGNIFLLYWFAATWDDPSGVYLENRKLANLPEGYKSKDSFFPIYLIFMAQHPELLKSVKPEKNSWTCGGSQELYLYRSGWESPKDTYFGIKAGSPGLNHAHMDCGSFVYDYAGIRWSADLGAEDYNSIEQRGMDLWNMNQDSERWSIFRYSNKSHSIFTLNDDRQKADGKARMVKTFDDSRHGAVIDLTDIYSRYAERAIRTAWVDDEGFLTVEDDITASDSADVPIMWVLNTVDDILITGENTAEISRDGVTMVLEVESPLPVEMTTWSNAPTTDYDSPNPGTARVGFVSNIPASREVTFKVTLKKK